MNRYKTKLNITFTTDAYSKLDARHRFIMQVLNHINLITGGKMKIELSDEEFDNWKKNTEKLPF